MRSFLRKHFLIILIFLAATAISLQALLKSGVFVTHDGIFHTVRAIKLFDELRRGQFPVRWVFPLDNGYGAPLFNYVYPMPYYLTAIPLKLGISNITSLKLLTLLSYFAGGFGLYLLAARSKLSKLTSTLIGLIYLFVPYQFVNIFVRGSLGETMVLGLAPFALLALQELSKGKIRWYSPLPLALALLSHNFLGLLLLGMLMLYSLLNSKRGKMITSILLSLSLSAFFVIPMIIESPYLLSSSLSQFSFLWSEHFVYPSQFVNSPWGYLFSRPGIGEDGMTFQLGYGTLTILSVYLGHLLFNLKSALKKLQNHFWMIVFLGAVYLMTPASYWIWNAIPLLSVMQFPWRLLGITTITSGFLLIGLASSFGNKHAKMLTLFLLVVLSLSIYNTWSFHSPRFLYTKEEFKREYSHYQSQTTTSYRSEIVPRWAHTERYQSTNPSLVNDHFGISSGPAILTVTRDKAGILEFSADAENDSAVAIYYQNYFPSWQAKVDGKSHSITPSDTGEILIPLLQGSHNYVVQLGSTPLEKFSNLISLLTLIFLGIMGWKGEGK